MTSHETSLSLPDIVRSLPIGIMAVALVLAFGVVPAMAAQAQPEASLDQATLKFIQDRKRLIEANLNLTEAEAGRFWPLYEKFQRDQLAMKDKRGKIIAEFGENYDAMTDAIAKKLLTDRLLLEEDRIRLWKAYLPRFEKVLPAKKLARYFQIENKIQASVEAGIAEEIPLIQ